MGNAKPSKSFVHLFKGGRGQGGSATLSLPQKRNTLNYGEKLLEIAKSLKIKKRNSQSNGKTDMRNQTVNTINVNCAYSLYTEQLTSDSKYANEVSIFAVRRR